MISSVSNYYGSWQTSIEKYNSYMEEKKGYYDNIYSALDSLKTGTTSTASALDFSGNSATKLVQAFLEKQSGTLSADTSSFVKDYASAFSELKSAAQNVKNAAVLSKTEMSAKSSDNTIAEVNLKSANNSQPEQLTVNVEQLATGQTNQGIGLNSNEVNTFSDSIFSITTSDGEFSFTSISNETQTNNEYLKSIANKINKEDIGITAKVVEKDGKSFLELQSQKTGTDSGFTIAGQMGDFIDQTNLGNVTQNAQNTLVTIGNERFESQNNTVNVRNDFEITALKEGQTDVTIAQSNENLKDALVQFAKSVNNAYEIMGDAPENSASLSSVKNSLSYLKTSINDELNSYGIQLKDGEVIVDEEKLNGALSTDSKSVLNSLTSFKGTMQKAINVANSAQRVSPRELAGIEQYSASLSKADLFKAYDNDLINLQVNFLETVSTYTASGMYSNNVYSGLMMNTFI